MRTAGQWALSMVRITDALALLALLLVPEVRLEIALIVLGLAVLSGWAARTERSVPERFGVLALLFAVALAAVGVWRLGLHPLVAAANAAPITHALLWLAPANARYRGWRIGMGFVDLVVASTVTVEIYLPVVFFLFAILAAVALSCNFLDSEFAQQGPEHAQAALPRGFIPRSFALAFLLFLSAGIIFPILPRQNQNAGLGWGSAYSKVGYTEEVRLEGLTPQAEPGGGSAVARFYTDGSEELEGLLAPGRRGYLRGATLPRFDGERWSRLPLDWRTVDTAGEGIRLRAIYEAAMQETVATPAGTLNLEKANVRPREQPRFYADGTWRDPHGQLRRREYQLIWRSGILQTDPPESLYSRRLPRQWPASRLARLANELFPPAAARMNASQALSRVESYFRQARIAASLTPAPVPAGTLPGLPVLDHFLFTAKAGHCEAFAATAALLLRSAGFSTRLVAGYRISRPPRQGVLTVRSGDAHAWVEVWDPGAKVWLSYDPTPRIAFIPGTLDVFRDAYDFASAQWYRFLTGYSDSAESTWQLGDLTLSAAERWKWLSPSLTTEIDWGRWLAGLAVGVAIAFTVGALLYLSGMRPRGRRSRRHAVAPWLVRERRRMDRLLQKWPAAMRAPAYKKWLTLYEEARFGPHTAGAAREQLARWRTELLSQR